MGQFHLLSPRTRPSASYSKVAPSYPVRLRWLCSSNNPNPAFRPGRSFVFSVLSFLWIPRRIIYRNKQASVAWQSLEQARRMHGGGPCNIPLVMRPRRLDSSYLQNKVCASGAGGFGGTCKYMLSVRCLVSKGCSRRCCLIFSSQLHSQRCVRKRSVHEGSYELVARYRGPFAELGRVHPPPPPHAPTLRSQPVLVLVLYFW